MATSSPARKKNIPIRPGSPQEAWPFGLNHGYEPLTKWDDPPSREMQVLDFWGEWFPSPNASWLRMGTFIEMVKAQQWWFSDDLSWSYMVKSNSHMQTPPKVA